MEKQKWENIIEDMDGEEVVIEYKDRVE
jgi:hypothetical protein